MKELLRTNDPVLISYIEVSLGRVGIQVLVLDTNASILDGSVGILPRRITVLDEDFEAARKTLGDAGLGSGPTSLVHSARADFAGEQEGSR